MPLFTRRRMLTTVGGAAALTPVAMAAGPASAATTNGPLTALRTPRRVFDSREDNVLLNGDKIEAEEAVIVTVGIPEAAFLASVFLNVTITETEGAGFLTVFPTDLSGKNPMPDTSNINWSGDGQTIANMAFTGVGGENGVEAFCGGLGRTHFIIDMQGYVPVELDLPT